MGDFNKFLTINGLKKKEIASYLGVSSTYITQISAGDRPLPAERLAQIKANQHGWDTSMLGVVRPNITLMNGTRLGERKTESLSSAVKCTLTDIQQSGHISYLQRKVDDQEKLIRELYQKIGTLEAMLDIQKGK